MANGAPYANLPLKRMAGNYGPDAKMRTAIAGYTPNVPWARFGEPTVVDFDGNGTSSATPQVAAAAALWIDKHRADYDAYREGWMRVEAVRKALFESAAKGDAGFAPELGAGMLRATDALALGAAPASQLVATPPDAASFALPKLLLGDYGPAFAATGPSKLSLLDLEATQSRGEVGPRWAFGDPVASGTGGGDARENGSLPDAARRAGKSRRHGGVHQSLDAEAACDRCSKGDEPAFRQAGSQAANRAARLPTLAHLRL